jgi:hypothetical protein
MNPDQLAVALRQMLTDIFGHRGCFRSEPLTLEEWKACDDRWLAMKQMNLRALTLKGPIDEVPKTQSDSRSKAP